MVCIAFSKQTKKKTKQNSFAKAQWHNAESAKRYLVWQLGSFLDFAKVSIISIWSIP